MKNKILFLILYIVSFILIILYLYTGIFGVIKYNPIIRIIIIFIICILMHFGGYFGVIYNKKYKNTICKINLIIWFILYIILLLTVTLFDTYFFRNGFLFVKWDKILL